MSDGGGGLDKERKWFVRVNIWEDYFTCFNPICRNDVDLVHKKSYYSVFRLHNRRNKFIIAPKQFQIALGTDS